MMRVIISSFSTVETQRLNDSQFGACGSGEIWDQILGPPMRPAASVAPLDDVSQECAVAAAGTGSLGPVTTVAVLSIAPLHAVTIHEGAPYVPVPADDAVEMTKTLDEPPVSAEVAELVSGEATTDGEHGSAEVDEIATSVGEIACEEQAETPDGVSSALGMLAATGTLEPVATETTLLWVPLHAFEILDDAPCVPVPATASANFWFMAYHAKALRGVSFASDAHPTSMTSSTLSVDCRGATPTSRRCMPSPRSPRSPRCPPARGFTAAR